MLPLGEDVLEVEVTGNRPDLLSVYGIAREVAALFRVELAPPPGRDPEAAGDEPVDVRIDDLAGCPRYVGRLFEDVTIAPSPVWLKARLLAIQALETARCFEEGVLTDVREADVGSILGFGYAPYSGGTLSYIDMMGVKAFVALCERLAQKYGDRFKPNKLLVEMAQKGESFYGRFAPKRQKQAA